MRQTSNVEAVYLAICGLQKGAGGTVNMCSYGMRVHAASADITRNV